jgi:hypothetical protein
MSILILSSHPYIYHSSQIFWPKHYIHFTCNCRCFDSANKPERPFVTNQNIFVLHLC